MMKLSAWLAIAFGVSIAAAQFLRNWGNWEQWPTWMVDEASAAVLVIAGVLTLKGTTGRFLAPAWGFSCGLFISSLIGYWRRLTYLDGALYDSHLKFMAIIGVLLTATFVGLALSLYQRRRAV